MSIILLKIGLVILPYYELIIRMLPYASVQTPNTRIAKIFLGLWVALAVGLSAVYSGEIRRCKNMWLLFFLAYIPLSIHLSPKFPIVINGANLTNAWNWKPFLTIIVYFLMFVAVQSMNITRDSLKGLLKFMVWCGAVMGVYVILQNFGWEQFSIIKIGSQFDLVTKRSVVGTLGHSTVVSPFMAMIVPLAIYLRRYIITIILITAVCFTNSTVAIAAMIISLMVYAVLRWRMKAFLALIILSLLSVSGGFIYKHHFPKKFQGISTEILQDNGRIKVWRDSINALKTEKIGKGETRYPLTGIGIGGYRVIMRPLLKSNFGEAHNDYLQVMVAFGIGGLVLFLLSIGYMFRDIFYAFLSSVNEREIAALTASFVCVGLVALGSFPWQIAPIIFYSVIVFGLLSNSSLTKEELC